MSSILEALKKLEEEKAARQSVAGQVVGKVAKSGRRPKQQPKWILPFAMAAVASIAVLFTYLFMGEEPHLSKHWRENRSCRRFSRSHKL